MPRQQAQGVFQKTLTETLFTNGGQAATAAGEGDIQCGGGASFASNVFFGGPIISQDLVTFNGELNVNENVNVSGRLTVDDLVSVGEGPVQQGYTIGTTVTAPTITGNQLIVGHYYSAASAATTLTFPGVTGVDGTAAFLNAFGITAGAGIKLPPVIVSNTAATNLTVTGIAGETVVGTAAINQNTATIHYIFTSATTADIVVVQSA